ncbi:hypothetical protein FHY55_18580 [Oceanicola sp. D3]|uniref:hypothetical protein n=1 Tax=Oceanicola sp. D3 TaxID=2587163 RepID=UPI00111DC936|nr:hypothetical protein [Oceanicola sp. D3]QDC11116.1 hypothetical protein FHY55_18580 [Oceanicola sp. D3]
MFRPINLIILAVLVAGVALVARETMRRGGGGEDVAAVAEQVVIGRTYRVDKSFVQRTGKVPGVAFQIILPKRPEQTHHIGVEELPEGGVVQFNFRAEDETFLESLFMAPIRIPMGKMDDRLAAIAPKLAEQGPALLGQKFEEVTSGEVREIRLGTGEGYRALELTGTYLDPRDEARYTYRFIAVPDPERAESLYSVSHINQAHLVIEGANFGPSLTGKALSTLRLMAPPVQETAGEAAGE